MPRSYDLALITQLVQDTYEGRLWKHKYITLICDAGNPSMIDHLRNNPDILIIDGFYRNSGLIKESIGTKNIIVISDKQKAKDAFDRDYGLCRRTFMINLNQPCMFGIPHGTIRNS